MRTALKNGNSAIADTIERAKAGSLSAFEEIVRENQRAVRAFIARQISDPQAVDDVSQEVFVAAYKGIARFRGDSSIASWLLGIARNHVLTYIRNRQRNRPLSMTLGDTLEDLHLSALEEDPTDPDREQFRVSALRSCLQSLNPDHRELVVRFYYNAETADVIGESYGRPAGTIRMMLLRIRRALRSCVERKLDTGGVGS